MSECEDEEDFFSQVRNKEVSTNPQLDTRILRLEEAEGCLVCTNCPIDNLFSTWDEADFTNHLSSEHPDSEEILCIYCGAYVTLTNVVYHLNRHTEYRSQSAFECLSCSLQTNQAKVFLEHTCSNDNQSPHTSTTCSHCQTQHSSVEELVRHVIDYLCVTVHCTHPGCLVKSTLRESIIQHMQLRHPENGISFRTSLQVLCNEPDLRRAPTTLALPGGMSTEALQSALMGALLGSLTGATGPRVGVPNGCDDEVRLSSLVFCLRCPYCNYSTTRWDRFTQHQSSCCKAHRFAHFVYQLYTCSLCRAVSTEQSLVEEHIETVHQGCVLEATVLSEEVSSSPIPSVDDNDLDSQSSERDSRKRGYENGHPPQNQQSLLEDGAKRPRMSTADSEDGYLSIGDGSDVTKADFDRVRFPFEEVAFARDFEDCREDPDVVVMEEKLRTFAKFTVRIYRRDMSRRVPECPECLKEFSHGLGDFKRHLMCVHLGVARINARDLLRYIGPEIAVSDTEEDGSRPSPTGNKAQFLEPGLRRISLPYSTPILLRLTEHLPKPSQLHLIKKMKIYTTQHVTLDTRGEQKKYRCDHCSYFSPHALADVRKHVMGSHCGISTKQFRYCLQASRLDPIEFNLLSDDRLMRLAKDLIKRKSLLPTTSTKTDPAPPSPLYSEDLSCDNNNSITSQIRTSNPAVEFNSDNDPLVSNNRQNCFRVAVDYDHEINVKLPFSEVVLRKLLVPLATEEQIEEVLKKMAIYASYTLVRLCKADKTVAFRCLCKRVFHTSRLPNSKIRAATLADSRRHIMGVHARISHEFLTICCQASRISRENNYLLYDDNMLLRLATDRPIKLPSLPGVAVPKDESTADNKEQQSGSNSCTSLRSLLTSSLKKEPRIEATSLLAPEEIDGDVERAIDLPYSMYALERLTDGYCPESYLPQLQAKMEIYASYKVYVTRRRGKRYFACSGCSSASPHGMGDIRKHILGVHAKVPERYKAASMHCSRLSREDNTLLPDHVLLQLAKMKWKGAIVRPLNELNEEEIAANVHMGNPVRRSLPTHLPSFGSSSFIPPSFSSISMVGPNGQLLNKQSPPACGDDPDDEQSMSTNGGGQEDSPEPLEPVEGSIEVPNDMYIFSSVNEQTGETEMACSLCSERSRSVGAIRGHIVRDHLGIPAHRCAVCDQLFKAKNDVLLHHQLTHSNKSFRLAQYHPYRTAMGLVQFREPSEVNESSQDCPA